MATYNVVPVKLSTDQAGFDPAVYLCEAEHLCGDDICASVCIVAARIQANQNSYEIGVPYNFATLNTILQDYVKLVSAKQYPSFTPTNSAAPLVNQIVSDTKQSQNTVYYVLYELYYAAPQNTSCQNTLNAANTTTIVQVVKQVVTAAGNVVAAIPKALTNLSMLTPYIPYIAIGGIGLYVWTQLPKRKTTI